MESFIIIFYKRNFLIGIGSKRSIKRQHNAEEEELLCRHLLKSTWDVLYL